jgi:hypothetical protein
VDGECGRWKGGWKNEERRMGEDGGSGKLEVGREAVKVKGGR